MHDTATPLKQPIDDYDQELIRQVHPPDWQNPAPAKRYNLVVIGAGSAGLMTSAVASQLGAKVALCERDLMGGDCLNVGCVPSKALLASAHAAGRARRMDRLGINTASVDPDFSQVMQRMRRLRSEISHHDSAKRFSDLGVDVFLGNASFTGPSTVEIDGATLNFRKALIATGARAAAPPIPGLSDVEFLTNDNVFSLTELPPRLGVIGGGPIGAELSQVFAELGSEVTLLEVGPQILGKDDPDAAQIVRRAIEQSGVKIVTEIKDLSVQYETSHAEGDGHGNHHPDGQPRPIQLQFQVAGENRQLTVDRLLVAAGRAPNVEGLGLEQAGVEYERRGVTVNDYLQTTNKHIYAAGDIVGKFQFTHAADFMARTVLANALFLRIKKLSSLTIPWCTYTDPELAHVGVTPAEAEQRKMDIQTFEVQFEQLDRAILTGQTDGFARVHTLKKSDRIVGGTVVGPNAGDLISLLTMAMTHRIGLKKVANTICPYPTMGEAIRRLGDQYNRSRVSPLISSLLKKFLAWKV